MTTGTRKRREYTEDFKRDAVVLATEQGYGPSKHHFPNQWLSPTHESVAKIIYSAERKTSPRLMLLSKHD